MALPNSVHGSFAHALRFGHRAATPVGRPRGFSLQRGFDEVFDLDGGNRGFTASAGFHLGQGCRTPLGKSLPPQQHGGTPDAQLLSNLIIRHPLGGLENDAAPGHDLLRGLMSANPGLKHCFLFRTDRQRLGWFPHAEQYSPNRSNCLLICETLH